MRRYLPSNMLGDDLSLSELKDMLLSLKRRKSKKPIVCFFLALLAIGGVVAVILWKLKFDNDDYDDDFDDDDFFDDDYCDCDDCDDEDCKFEGSYKFDKDGNGSKGNEDDDDDPDCDCEAATATDDDFVKE